MRTPEPVPEILRSTPLLLAEARAAGVSEETLRGPAYQRLFQGVYCAATLELTTLTRCQGALLALPQDAVFEGVTGLRLYGLDIGPELPLHVASHHQVRMKDTAGRRTQQLPPHVGVVATAEHC